MEKELQVCDMLAFATLIQALLKNVWMNFWTKILKLHYWIWFFELDSKEVWEKFNEGCSVRILHPQRWINKIWLMLSVLETHWNSIAGPFIFAFSFFFINWTCNAGCNVYLTPEGSQGFSPHFDDIEAFILQLEGKKKWKCYKPRSEAEVLPRFSSQNFSQEEIGEPILEVDLQPGDLL